MRTLINQHLILFPFLAMSPCFSEKLFGVIEKHFPIVQTLFLDYLRKLQMKNINITNGCLIYPSEKSFSLLVGTSLAERSNTQHDLGSLLNSSDALALAIRESILDAIKIFTSDDEELNQSFKSQFQDIKNDTDHPIFGRKENNEEIAPQIQLGDGQSEIFIPTKTMVDTILSLQFYLRHW